MEDVTDHVGEQPAAPLLHMDIDMSDNEAPGITRNQIPTITEETLAMKMVVLWRKKITLIQIKVMRIKLQSMIFFLLTYLTPWSRKKPSFGHHSDQGQRLLTLS